MWKDRYIYSLFIEISLKKENTITSLTDSEDGVYWILAGGVAHDFNNFLTGILGHLEIILQQPLIDEESIRRLKHVENLLRKTGSSAIKLLSFAREKNLEKYNL